MAGQLIEFTSNGATTQGYLARPDSGQGPGVIVIQEWWGLVDHIKGPHQVGGGPVCGRGIFRPGPRPLSR